MTGSNLKTVSKTISSTDYLYQGTSNDPPAPSHFEHTLPDTSKTYKCKTNCILKVFKDMKLEIVAFLFVFSRALITISSTSMILEKVCIAHFKYPVEVCHNLQNHSEIKVSVERVSTNYQLGHTLIQTAPAALLSCFIGPWSDHYGRLIPCVIAILGITLDSLGSAICAYFIDSRVEYYYIAAAFTGLSGGNVTLLAVVYSYASDMTTFEKRTLKYAFLEMAVGLAIPAGVAAGGGIYSARGYPVVFLVSTCGLFASLMWVIFLLPETRGLEITDPWSVKLKQLFRCKTFRESFIATAKKRPNQGRTQIILLILSICFLVISTNSTVDISFLYVHHQFDWGNSEFSTVTAAYSICALIVLLIVVPLFKRFKTGDATLGLIGTTSLFLKLVGIGLANRTAIYHIANLLGLLSACASLAVRSRISKVVSNDDLGKVFSFVATAESLLPVLTTVLTSQIFNAFLDVFPGMPYIILSVFLLLPISVFIWLTCLPVPNTDDVHRKNSKEIQKETYTSIDT